MKIIKHEHRPPSSPEGTITRSMSPARPHQASSPASDSCQRHIFMLNEFHKENCFMNEEDMFERQTGGDGSSGLEENGRISGVAGGR